MNPGPPPGYRFARSNRCMRARSGTGPIASPVGAGHRPCQAPHSLWLGARGVCYHRRRDFLRRVGSSPRLRRGGRALLGLPWNLARRRWMSGPQYTLTVGAEGRASRSTMPDPVSRVTAQQLLEFGLDRATPLTRTCVVTRPGQEHRGEVDTPQRVDLDQLLNWFPSGARLPGGCVEAW